MKNTIILLIIVIISISCKDSYVPRESISISIEKIKMDSTSIRAIEIINDSAIVYAGSKGDIGIVSGSKVIKLASKIITDTIVPHFRSLAFNNNNVYALSIGNPALLYQYQNKKFDLVYKEEHEKVFYDSMKFFDDVNGIAMGDPIKNCLSIIVTRDGGTTWGKINCEDLPKVADGEAAFAASNTNITIVGENAWIVTGGKKARIFHTPDMGLSWKVHNTPIIQGESTTGIYSVDFYSEEQGIIAGGNYLDKFGEMHNIALTFNGGKTWEMVSDNNAPKYVSCIQYIPNTQGKEVIAVSTNGIFYSNNAGLNWTKISDEGFYTVRIANQNTAWVSGNEVIAKLKMH